MLSMAWKLIINQLDTLIGYGDQDLVLKIMTSKATYCRLLTSVVRAQTEDKIARHQQLRL